jgi:hypothetical protein
MLEDDEEFVYITHAQASCAIAALFYEFLIPCPCEKDAVNIEGVTFSGEIARIRIKGDDIRFYGSDEDTRRLYGRCPYENSRGRTSKDGGNSPSGGT